MRIDQNTAEIIAQMIAQGNPVTNSGENSLSFVYRNGKYFLLKKANPDAAEQSKSLSQKDFIAEIQKYEIDFFFELKEDIEKYRKGELSNLQKYENNQNAENERLEKIAEKLNRDFYIKIPPSNLCKTEI